MWGKQGQPEVSFLATVGTSKMKAIVRSRNLTNRKRERERGRGEVRKKRRERGDECEKRKLRNQCEI